MPRDDLSSNRYLGLSPPRLFALGERFAFKLLQLALFILQRF